MRRKKSVSLRDIADTTKPVSAPPANANSNIVNAYDVEPFGVDHNEYDVFLGYVNYAPNYDTCQ